MKCLMFRVLKIQGNLAKVFGFLLSMFIVCSSSGQTELAIKQFPLENGWVRLMEDGRLDYNFQSVTNGDFLAGGILDGDDQPTIEGRYYSNETVSLLLEEGAFLDLYYDREFYYILYKHASRETPMLLVFDGSKLLDAFKAKNELEEILETTERTERQNSLDRVFVETGALGLIGGVAVDSLPIMAGCAVMIIHSVARFCYRYLANMNSIPLDVVASEFSDQIESAEFGLNGPHRIPESVSSFHIDKKLGVYPFLELDETVDGRTLRVLIGLNAFGNGVLRSQGRICESSLLSL